VLNRANNIGGGVGLSNFNAVLSVGNAGALGTGLLTASGGELLGIINETLTNYIESDGAFSIAAAHGTTLDIGSAGWSLGNDGVLPNFGGPGQDGTVVLHVPSISSSGGTGSAQSEIQSGTLKAGDANIGGLLGDPILDSGATLDLAGFSESLGRLHGYGTVTNSGAAATLTVSSGSDFDAGGSSFAGSITGAIALTIAGSATLSGANTYTGTTAIDSVTGDSLTLGNGGATGSIGGGNIDDEGTLIIDRNNALTLTNAIFGGGLLDQQGTGTTSINTANSYSGGTTISAGTLAVGIAGALGTGPLSITGGELLGTATETLANSLNLQGSFTIAAAHGTTLTIGSGGLQLTQATGDTLFFGAPGQDGTVTVIGDRQRYGWIVPSAFPASS
jgi:autotransporter-associated beta strand protein